MDALPTFDANYAPLTPLTFLLRAASNYADRTSVVYGDVKFTYRQTYDRCVRLASVLRSRLNISKNDIVSVLAPNIPATLEMHFAVPMAGAVLNAINTRLDAGNVATILRHAEPKVLFVDCQMIKLATNALQMVASSGGKKPVVVLIDDLNEPTGVARYGEQLEYEGLIARGDPSFIPIMPEDEQDPITLNYTSGTTSAPKGVVYSHRGAYLSALSLILGWEMGSEPVYLWTLPMFHCNGWTFTWGVFARGGVNVCLRTTAPADIRRAIAVHGITHLCCAPVIFNMLLEGAGGKLPHPVYVLTGGAPPPAALLETVESMGFRVTHAYGLTEATGPAMVNEWRAPWNSLPAAERAKLKARQGLGVLSLSGTDVINADTMESVPRDGKTMGEIVLKGSSIMKGYYKDPENTAKAFRGGWFFTGDVGVVHPDGYVEIKDRSKDVIISGGENISSVEVEAALYQHPAVAEASVVAMPHPKWGETPCAFISVKKGSSTNEEEIIKHCRKMMAGFMVPKKVVAMPELPKTATGKIQKNVLKAAAKKFKLEDQKRAAQEQVVAASRL